MIPTFAHRMLRNLSIRRKLTAIVVLTSGVAVILASALFLTYDYNSAKQQVVTDLDRTAEVLGLSTYPALDAESASSGVGTQAEAMLALIVGSLRVYPSIEHGVIFDVHGRAVGGQERNILVQRPTPAFVAQNSHEFTDEGLTLYRRVTTPDGRFVGVVYLLSNTSELNARLRRYLGILAAVTFVSLLASLLLASQLQKVISRPDPPPRRRRDTRLAGEGLLGAGGQGGRRRARRPHRRLQRHARPDPVPRRGADRGQGGGGAGQHARRARSSPT